MSGRTANVALASITFVISVLFAEAVARALGLAPEVMLIEVSDERSVFQRSENPILGFELKPNYRDPDPNFIISYARTNAHGQRDIERSLEKPEGTRRILLLGDSVVEGAGIETLDHTIPRSLERLFADPAVEVLNFGVSGYCTRAEVELLEVKGLAFDPDVVVMLFVGNDFDNFNRQLFQLGNSAPRPAWVKLLYLRSHLFRVSAIELDLYRLGIDADPIGWNSEAIGDNNVVEGLERLGELADREGFAPLIAIWPTFSDDAIRDLHFMPRSEDVLVIERLAAAVGIPSFRMSDYFRRDREEAPREINPRLRYTTGDEMHPSRRGSKVAALALREELASLGGRSRASADPEAAAAARVKGREAPRYAITYNNTGNELSASGKLEDAIVYYRRALTVDPGYEKAHNNLANVLVALGRHDEAIEAYKRAIEIAPRYVDAHYNLGTLLERRGESEVALKLYRRALAINPDLVLAQSKLAALLASLGRHDEVVRLFEEALVRHPQSRKVREQLAEAEKLRARARP